jgi:hypothetical protein
MMTSMGDLSMSAESSVLKISFWGKKWVCLMAGDLCPIPDIKRGFAEFCEKEDPRGPLSLAQMSDAFKYAFERELDRRALATTLSPYGLTFDNYRDEGPKLGIDTYSRILFDLRNNDLGLKLLVAGFDDDKGHIFAVGKRGIAEHYDGYWAIGSGDIAALGSLFNSRINPTSDPEEVFYRACCAKFSAETSPGVGEATVVCILKKDGSREFIHEDAIKSIRTEWERTRSPSLRPRTKSHITAILESIKPEA